ncbi:RicAFT regulatory complex protein RicA family protein [Caldalkalibacillus mannanilyticus]|uniref:RicAFT regulatory complex protein RicA family protein n=1 Tax=Caldalkalibacillus mannanilyticus TaxID=1418 RepID=UPI0004686F36|nr:YlbF family regulator [Caldalkalibacillus mannanilyticus]
MEKTEKTVTRKEIMEQAERLALLISQSEEVEFFKKAEQQIKKNEKVQKLINVIKFKQKQAVHAEHYEKEKHLGEVEDSLEKLHQELDEIPVVQEFKQSQLEVNELLQLITSVISNTVTDQIIISTGGDPLSGQTGGSNPSCPIR